MERNLQIWPNPALWDHPLMLRRLPTQGRLDLEMMVSKAKKQISVAQDSKLEAFLQTMAGDQSAPGEKVALIRLFASFQFFTPEQVKLHPIIVAQGPTAPSDPPGAEPFAAAGPKTAGGCPLHFRTSVVLLGMQRGQAPCRLCALQWAGPQFSEALLTPVLAG